MIELVKTLNRDVLTMASEIAQDVGKAKDWKVTLRVKKKHAFIIMGLDVFESYYAYQIIR